MYNFILYDLKSFKIKKKVTRVETEGCGGGVTVTRVETEGVESQ